MNQTRTAPQHVVLFDGVCNFCSASVAFIIRRDPTAQIVFAPLQSPAGARVLAEAKVKPESLPDSVVLVSHGTVYTESDAALRIAGLLRFPWMLAGVFWILPRPIRDGVYRFIARNRLRWFGRKDVCMIPTPSIRGRFL